MARPKTRFVVVGGCFLAGLAGLTLSFIETERCRCGCSSEAVAKSRCLAELRGIWSAKVSWMIENNKTTNDAPTWSDFVGPDSYLTAVPKCPDGGSYTIGRMAELPTCSVPAHNEFF